MSQVTVTAQYVIDPQQARLDQAKEAIDRLYQTDCTIVIDETVRPFSVAVSPDFSEDVLLQIAHMAKLILKGKP